MKVTDQPYETLVLERLLDVFATIGTALGTASEPARVVLVETHQKLQTIFDDLDAKAPLCLWQDPDVDHSWKCQLWLGHRQEYHSCA